MIKLLNRKQKRGVTLIELIISMAILTIVLSLVFRLLIYNSKVFYKSEDLSQVQFDVRMASDYISTEIRNVKSISLTSGASIDNSIDLAFLSGNYPSVKSVEFVLKAQGQRYLLSYVIEGSDAQVNNKYKLETDVLLNNVSSAVTGTDNKVFYTK